MLTPCHGQFAINASTVACSRSIFSPFCMHTTVHTLLLPSQRSTMTQTFNRVRMITHNVFFQTALERKLSLADRTHNPLDTSMRGRVIVVISTIVVPLTTDLTSEFY